MYTVYILYVHCTVYSMYTVYIICRCSILYTLYAHVYLRMFRYDPSRSKQRSIDPHSPSHGLFVPRPATPSPCARRMAPSGVHLQENQAAISTKTHLSGRSQRMHDAQLGVGIQPRYCKQGEMNCTEERACKSVMGNSGRIGSGSTFLQASDETVQVRIHTVFWCVCVCMHICMLICMGITWMPKCGWFF